MSANANPAHLLWQERVDKERKLAKRQIMKQLVLDGEEQKDAEPEAPPLHDLHQCMSLPALGASSFTPLPKIGTSASRSMTRRRPGSTASVASLRSAQQRPSQSASRSSLTGLTTASLRKEVHDAVTAEVAKMMQPLKEKLHAEQTTRQRLEKMLQVAKGQKAYAA
mmetsp:Transcript_123862/g.174694  ORF Transcript_123862/g.174694 Transcript_123862/m.174694 type:complete len:166 (-) Transcript_123862:161-658(-)